MKLASGTADRAYPRFPDPPWGGGSHEYWENVDMGGGALKVLVPKSEPQQQRSDLKSITHTIHFFLLKF